MHFGTVPQRLVQRATVPGPRPPAVHSAEHQWQLKLSHVEDVAEQVGLSVSKVWPKTDTFGGLGMCILTVESHQGSALWCHCCNHWLSGDIKHHSLHSKHIEYILAWSRETALQMLLHGMLLQKVACSKGQWTKKVLQDKQKDIWEQIERGDVRVESVSEQEVVPKCATPGCDFESKASCGWVTCCKKCAITNGQDHGARCDSIWWQRKEEEEDAGEQEEP